MRVVNTRRGARLIEGDTVVSEVLAEPGASHTLFDVLAATIAALSPGPRVALLGFAGGGLVAPLRALGFDAPLQAVDLSLDGARVFRRVSGAWAGKIDLARDDAARWLARKRAAYDLILEDLFAFGPRGMVKPEASFAELPRQIRARLAPRGIAVFNTLAEPGKTWAQVTAPLAQPFRTACSVRMDEYENRLVVAGRDVPPARDVSRALRTALTRLGSRQATQISVVSL